jgi:hypothetical protein
VPILKFHVLNDTSFEIDKEGIELPDLAAARAHAVRILGQIIQDELGRTQDPIHLAVLVDDEDGVRVANARCLTTLVWTENPFPTDRFSVSD